MATSGIKPGVPVILRELDPSSPFFKHGQSLLREGELEHSSPLFFLHFISFFKQYAISYGNLSLQVLAYHPVPALVL